MSTDKINRGGAIVFSGSAVYGRPTGRPVIARPRRESIYVYRQNQSWRCNRLLWQRGVWASDRAPCSFLRAETQGCRGHMR